MRCHDVATALLESSPPWPPEARAHLEGCEDCRTLAAVHASASGLRLPQPPPLAPVPREAVLREVRRRKVRRRAVAGVVASFCVGLVTWLSGLEAPSSPGAPALQEARVELPDESGTAPHPELGLRRAEGADDVDLDSVARAVRAERGSLSWLVTEVRGYSRRDVVFRDDTYKPFGTMAAWLRPPDSRALENPPFRTAVLPLNPQESLP
ncbi:hypothetical protein [Myxococcus sp. CA040A]|uniref:hypothetical protein n=1 Tax=Myxococcus sp. CA040A TaxID=2741738 RepID=UPI00157A481D|nr:hypothetical protein [Myxococcus sp. CA040A]NTX07968.1 hypothetical protein [Myxococcus sp. CA040A]